MSQARNGQGPIISRPGVQMGQYYYSQQEFCEYILHYFKQNLRDYENNPEKAVKQASEIACKNMQISGRHFCRPLDTLTKPITPQEQSDLIKSIGVPMIAKAVEEALGHAGLSSKDIGAVVYTSHLPFPFPPLSTQVMNKLDFKRDCVNMPCLSMGCAGGGYALRMARDWLLSHSDSAAIIINCELCSLGFRPHKKGMSWFLNTALFGDAVAATVVRGSEFVGGKDGGLQIVHGKQRQVRNTTDVSFFTYDEWGYHFITTQALCEVAEANCPEFAKDIVKEAFEKQPKEIKLNMIHPGGARMIQDIGGSLGLEGSLSAKMAWSSMNRVGNVASATVTDMIEKAWDEFEEGDEALVVGMGPGFVLDGVCLKMVSENNRLHAMEVNVAKRRQMLACAVLAGASLVVGSLARTMSKR